MAVERRQSDYMTWDLPNPLPDDGYPRLTMEGYEILREGLNGNFDRWCASIGNHSRSIGHDKCRCLTITCDPKSMHFQITLWFGKFPTLEYRSIAPTIEFNKVDTRRYNVAEGELPPEGIIELKNTKDGFFTTGIPILLDDYGMNARKRVFYKCFEKKSDLENEDEEYEDEECCATVKPVEPVKSKVKPLDAWFA